MHIELNLHLLPVFTVVELGGGCWCDDIICTPENSKTNNV
jgi:hypothetical protein